jgi:hypothetical protein
VRPVGRFEMRTSASFGQSSTISALIIAFVLLAASGGPTHAEFSSACNALNNQTFNIAPGGSYHQASAFFKIAEQVTAFWQWTPPSKTGTASLDVGEGPLDPTPPGGTSLVAKPFSKNGQYPVQLSNRDQNSTMSGTLGCVGGIRPYYPDPKILGNDSVPPATQGSSVAVSADGITALVGGPGDNSGMGATWVYSRTGGIWVQQGPKLVGTNVIGNAFQGSAVALSADGATALVGGPSDGSQNGAVWVFIQNAGNWVQQAKLVGSGVLGTYANQGTSVALSADGNTAIVGGPCDNSPGQCPYGAAYGVGAAWVFVRNGTTWTQQAKLVPNNNSGGASFASSIALSADGNTALVGGPNDNSNAGAAWVFTRSSGIWTQQSKLLGTSPSSTSFGTSVALSADASTAAVGGSQLSSPDFGGVWFLNPISGAQQGFIATSIGAAFVTLSGDAGTAAIGQTYSYGGIGSAAVYTYTRGSWVQLAPPLLGGDAIGPAAQGASIALSHDGNTMLVGGPRDNSSTGATWAYEARSIARHDFNTDGKSDILWQDFGGNAALWLMNGTQPLQTSGLGNVAGWSIIGQRDFTGGGAADILWRDTNGDLALWMMNGLQVSSSASLGNVPPNWSVFGTGDLNGDGIGDILWSDNDGNLAIWFMNDGQVVSATALGQAPNNWTIIGDDNQGDVFWQDAVGDVAIWQMNGSQVVASAVLASAVPSNWKIAGWADYNGDGYVDLLWHDIDSGTVAIWFLNGTQVQSTASLGAVPSAWNIAQTGDYDGDGTSDILWIDSSGNLAVWFFANGAVSSSVSYGNVGTAWAVQSRNSE